MNSLNNAKRRMLALLLVLVVSVFAVTPVFAQEATFDPASERVGTAMVKMEKETLRVRVIEEKLPTGKMQYKSADSKPQASPLYPMWYYTCYFEGVRIPCEFLAWLWY
jgi:hypothetical protein